jgi:hypothetical protein
MHAKFMLGFDAFFCTRTAGIHRKPRLPLISPEPPWLDEVNHPRRALEEIPATIREIRLRRTRRAIAIAGSGASRRLHEMTGSGAVAVALVQGGFYAATGVWALVDLDSFMAVTGPKVDHWLVKTVGALVTVIGGVLLAAARSRRVTAEIVLLGAGSALALAAIDVVYVSLGRISSIYLLDAFAEVGLAVAWMLARGRE